MKRTEANRNYSRSRKVREAMILRDFLNEFELDWAQAAVRSELIPGQKLKNAKILLIGEQPELQKAIAWSFMAWNDSIRADICVKEAALEERGEAKGSAVSGGLQAGQKFCGADFAPQEADYVILTGLCSRDVSLSGMEAMDYLRRFNKLAEAVTASGCRRILLLSDGRVYGRTGPDFAASEYEAGQTDPCVPGYEAQYLLQTMESILAFWARERGIGFNILRTGLIYGPCLPMMAHPAARLAAATAAGEPFSLELSREKNSYICIHDVLTAIQFVLTKCPKGKIFNAAGLASTISDGEAAMLLYQNFPDRCKVTMTSPGQTKERAETREESGQPENFAAPGQERSGGIWLNTQLLEHYGFEPKISMEDGLIILVKSLENTGEVFIFDNTYLGKLEKVQQILLGYLLEIDRICKKHGIKYFLAGGTLLGAIRHHGFIPWDDDADVMMLREDYDKFQKVAQQELPDNIFMQIPETEKGNYNPFTKLRINNTMFATEFTSHFMDMHNGIFFDVLAHDKTGNHRWSRKLHLMVTMLARSVVFNKWGDTDIKGGGAHPVVCRIVDRVKYLIPMRFALWAQNRSLEFFKNRKSDYLYDGMGRNLSRGAFPAKWLEEAVYVDFEGYPFPVPKEYDKYLTYLYGDYMQMIPVSQRRTSHSIVLMDLGAYCGYAVPEAERKEK